MLCRPNVGGVVGLADLYVDPALGFSLGWAAWVSSGVRCSIHHPTDARAQYNWSVTLRKHFSGSFYHARLILEQPQKSLRRRSSLGSGKKTLPRLGEYHPGFPERVRLLILH